MTTPQTSWTMAGQDQTAAASADTEASGGSRKLLVLPLRAADVWQLAPERWRELPNDSVSAEAESAHFAQHGGGTEKKMYIHINLA